MGQAKARKAEIDAMKNSMVMLHIHAIRHTRSGMRETMAFGQERDTVKRVDKNEILGVICDNEWLADRDTAASLITEYLLQTKSYKMMNLAVGLKPYGYEINFYETGAQPDQPSNVFGCRIITGIYSEESFHRIINDEINDAKARGAFTEQF